MSQITTGQIHKLASLGHFGDKRKLTAPEADALQQENATMTTKEASDIIKRLMLVQGVPTTKEQKAEQKSVLALVFAAMNAALVAAISATGEGDPAKYFLVISGPGVDFFRPFGQGVREDGKDHVIIRIPALDALPAEVSKAGYKAFQNLVLAKRYAIELRQEA